MHKKFQKLHLACRQPLLTKVKKLGFTVKDHGTNSAESCDYPDYAHALGRAVAKSKRAYGIVMCGSGVGISIAANKVAGIRCGLVHDAYTAKMIRAHNNCNVVAFGARVVGWGVIESILEAFFNEPFERHNEKHLRRSLKLDLNLS